MTDLVVVDSPAPTLKPPRLSVVRRLAARVTRLVPLRPTGLVLAATAAAIVFSWGPKEADFLLYPAAVVTLGLVAVTVLLVTLGTLWLLRAVRRLEPGVPERLVTTRLEASGFRVPRLRGVLVLDVRVEWLEPRGVAVALEPDGGDAQELVTPTQRGRGTRVVRRFTVEDAFGLARLSFDFAWPAAFQVEPVVARASAELAASRAHGDALANPTGRAEGDLVEMRAYGPGDSMRHVLWKTYARTRRLLVRMPERALAPSPISVAFFVAGEGDEATASVARLYVEAGLLGPDFLFAADGASRPARTIAEVVDQLVASAAHRARGGEGLNALAQQIDPARLTACVAFVPAIDGPWRPRLVDLMRRLGLRATVILGVDQVPAEERLRGRLERWFLRAPEGLGETRDVTALKAALLAEGFTVHVIHRATGQTL